MNSFSMGCFIFVGVVFTLCFIYAIGEALRDRGQKKIWEEHEKERLEDLKHEKHDVVELPYHTDHKPMVLQDAIFNHPGWMLTDYNGLVKYIEKDKINIGRWTVAHDHHRLYNNCKYNMYYINIKFLRMTYQERKMGLEADFHFSLVKRMEKKGYHLDHYHFFEDNNGKRIEELKFIHEYFDDVEYRRVDLDSISSRAYNG